MLLRSSICSIVVMFLSSWVWGQGGPPCPSSCPPIGSCSGSCGAVCDVYTQSQLQAALLCNANGTGCCQIRIPQFHSGTSNPVVLDINTQISIAWDHHCLHLRIEGTLRWVGSAGTTQNDMSRMIRIRDACKVTIDGAGTGRITSQYAPCQDLNDPPGCKDFIVHGIHIIGGSNNITIKDISVMNVYDAMDVADTAHTLAINNVNAEELNAYGAFIKGSGVTIMDSNVQHVYAGHAFRSYGSNVSIANSAAGNIDRTGFWLAGGDDLSVNGFTSAGQWVRVGPDHGTMGGDPIALRAKRVSVQNVTVTGSNTDDHLMVELGTLGAYINNLTVDVTKAIAIGRDPGSNVTQRPLDRVYWGNVYNQGGSGTGRVCIANNSCIGQKVSGCVADITHDHVVNVNDLLAVINAWGSCGTISEPTCTSPTSACAADISPNWSGTNFWGDGQVNVNDPLAVINNWGCRMVPVQGQPGCYTVQFNSVTVPQFVSDCFNDVCEGLTGEDWSRCVDACIQAVCEKDPSQCE